ncbi:MAG TPA: lipid-binding SYLF domain-containing protein [Thiobacillaceae bacterium]|nr:lipid-binding SYLF domain-containing protein [Thiobacillaceae bacterium]HNU65087.1 lipid-binding SYLF domain-containing protein [Thiobacillaceae bacterium]
MNLLRISMARLAIPFLFSLSSLALAEEQASGTDDPVQILETASQIFDHMFASGLGPGERAKVSAVLKDAHGFVVLPNVIKVGMGLTLIQGRGVLVFQDEKGVWQPPIPLRVSGQGIGPHFGLIAYDTLIPIMKQTSLTEILDANHAFTGMEAMGPLQISSAAEHGLLAYTRGKGLSAGMALDNIRITLDQRGIETLYGIRVEPLEIAAGKLETCRKPLPAQKLIEKVNEVTGNAPVTFLLVPQSQ